jgi:hypothetical protein
MFRPVAAAAVAAVLLVVQSSSAAQTPPTADAELAKGISQAKSGDFDAALLTLDAVARRLESAPAREKDLAQAYLYLGVAYVGLLQESPARDNFKKALKHDKTLTLDPAEFPPRVVRVFEATRTGKSKSALYKGGIGAVGIGAIAVGAALLSSGATVASASGGGAFASPPPSPAAATVTLVSTNPAAGSTLSAALPVPLSIQLSVTSSQDTTATLLRVELVNSTARCLAAEVRGGALRGNTAQTFTVGPFTTDLPSVTCTTPFTTTAVSVRVFGSTDTSQAPIANAQLPATFNFTR